MNSFWGEINEDLIEYNIRFLRQVVFEVTEGCNLRCEYCGFSDLYYSQKGRGTKNLPYSYAETLLDYLFSFWEDPLVKDIPISTAVSFYGGEPLLNMTLIKEIVGYVESRKKNTDRVFTYSLTTNATLLLDHIDFLAAHQFRIMISLDGDEYADSYRIDAKGKPSFSRVFQNIKVIKERYPDYYSDCVTFNAVLTDRNSYEGLVSFFEEEFGKTPQISPLSTSNLNPSSRERFERIQNRIRPDNSLLPFWISPAFQTFKKDFELKSGNYFYDFSELLFDRVKKKSVYTGTCFPFSRKLFLTAAGKILQCEKISHEYNLGQVSETGVQLDFNEAASKHNAAIRKYGETCSDCRIRHTCPQCIYRADEPECKYKNSSLGNPFSFENVSYNPAGALEAVYNTKTKR